MISVPKTLLAATALAVGITTAAVGLDAGGDASTGTSAAGSQEATLRAEKSQILERAEVDPDVDDSDVGHFDGLRDEKSEIRDRTEG